MPLALALAPILTVHTLTAFDFPWWPTDDGMAVQESEDESDDDESRTGWTGDDELQSTECQIDLFGTCWVTVGYADGYECECDSEDWVGSSEVPGVAPGDLPLSEEQMQKLCKDILRSECEEQPPGPVELDCSSDFGSCTVWSNSAVSCMCGDDGWGKSGDESVVLTEQQMLQLCEWELYECTGDNGDDDDDDDNDDEAGDDDDNNDDDGAGDDDDDDDDDADDGNGDDPGSTDEPAPSDDDAGLVSRGCSVSGNVGGAAGFAAWLLLGAGSIRRGRRRGHRARLG